MRAGFACWLVLAGILLVPSVEGFGQTDVFNGATTESLGTLSAAPTLTVFTTGGHLTTGTYCYRFTAVDAAGQTLPSPENCATVGSGVTTGVVKSSWSSVTNATGYNVYGRAMGAEQFMATILAPTTSFNDGGAATPSGPLPATDTSGAILSLSPLYPPLIAYGISGGLADPYYNVKAFGAQGNAQTGTDGAMTSGSTTLTASSSTPFSCTPSCGASPDKGKSIVVDMSPAPPPVVTSGSQSTTTGSLPSSTTVYYRLTFLTSGGADGSDASLEAFVNLDSTHTAIQITSPPTTTGISGYFVYASDGSTASASGQETKETMASGDITCTFVTGSDACQIGSNATVTAINTSGSPPPASVVLGPVTISSVTSTSTVVLSSSATATVSGATYSWANDDTSAINTAISACLTTPGSGVGCRIFFPPGSYWVQGSPALSIAGTSPPQQYIALEGAGAAGTKQVAPPMGGPLGTIGLSSAASEIVTADHTYALTVGNGTATAALNGGPEISNLGFRDVSGNGHAIGAIHFEQVSHAFLNNVSFIDFANGTGAYFDSTHGGSAGGISQFNFALNTTAVNVRTPFLFQNGVYSSNWFVGGQFVSSQVGGGYCIDFEANGTSGTGGHNYIIFPQCNYFPIAVHLDNQNSDSVSFHAEQSAMNISGVSVIGSSGNGTGVLVEGSSTSNCLNNLISQTTLTSFTTGISVTSNCANTAITSPSYATVSTGLSDSGLNTQTIGAPPASQAMTFAGSGYSLVQYFSAGTSGSTLGYLQCFQTALSVADCSSSLNTTNYLGVALNAGSASVPVGVQVVGTATVQLDASQTVQVGHLVCQSTTNSAEGSYVMLSTGTCGSSALVGVVAQGSGTTSVNSALVFLHR